MPFSVGEERICRGAEVVLFGGSKEIFLDGLAGRVEPEIGVEIFQGSFREKTRGSFREKTGRSLLVRIGGRSLSFRESIRLA